MMAITNIFPTGHEHYAFLTENSGKYFKRLRRIYVFSVDFKFAVLFVFV